MPTGRKTPTQLNSTIQAGDDDYLMITCMMYMYVYASYIKYIIFKIVILYAIYTHVYIGVRMFWFYIKLVIYFICILLAVGEDRAQISVSIISSYSYLWLDFLIININLVKSTK